jgi:hypothetical protein
MISSRSSRFFGASPKTEVIVSKYLVNSFLKIMIRKKRRVRREEKRKEETDFASSLTFLKLRIFLKT